MMMMVVNFKFISMMYELRCLRCANRFCRDRVTPGIPCLLFTEFAQPAKIDFLSIKKTYDDTA